MGRGGGAWARDPALAELEVQAWQVCRRGGLRQRWLPVSVEGRSQHFGRSVLGWLCCLRDSREESRGLSWGPGYAVIS